MDAPELWKQKYEIKVYESDALGRSSFPALCDYIQDMAWRHYTNVEKALGNLLPSGQVWLMTRLEVEVINLPKWQDIIEVETWSRGIEKFYAFRDFVITGNDGKEAAKGTTTWVVLDTVNNKIARLTELASKWPSRAFVSGPHPFGLIETRNQIRSPRPQARRERALAGPSCAKRESGGSCTKSS